MKIIRIDHPGDGEWVMKRVGGVFSAACDHVIASVRDGAVAGGFVLCDYLGASIVVHMAGNDEKWCSRDMLWMLFDYAFNQLGCRKLIAPVPSTNTRAMELDMRAGFVMEAMIRDAMPDGHLVLLTMTREQCRWLNVRPLAWRPGHYRKEHT